MEEQIRKINNLNRTISSLKDFLNLLELSNAKSSHSTKDREKINEFSMFNFRSYVWTGTDNPSCERRIEDRETMNDISETIKPLIREKIQKYEEQLRNLLATPNTQ